VPETSDRSHPHQKTRFFPDARAYVVILIAVSPLFLLWGLVWLRKGFASWPVVALIAALVALGWLQLSFRAVRVGESGIVQGYTPLVTRIAYQDISRIHRVFVSSRYGSTSCLAISAAGDKQIVLPMKSFSLEKRNHLVKLLMAKAPQARCDLGAELS
jgi:hypothetical protein